MCGVALLSNFNVSLDNVAGMISYEKNLISQIREAMWVIMIFVEYLYDKITHTTISSTSK